MLSLRELWMFLPQRAPYNLRLTRPSADSYTRYTSVDSRHVEVFMRCSSTLVHLPKNCGLTIAAFLIADQLATSQINRATLYSSGIVVPDAEILAERAIYGADSPPQTHRGQSSPEMFKSLRFGQPSLLRLRNGEFLACHWVIEEGQ